MSTVQIATLQDAKWTVSRTINQPKVYALQWSPLSRILATWEQYGSAPGQDPKPNLHLWDAATGEIVKSLFQKKFGGWAPTWNKDESVCSRLVNNEIQFYADNDFSAIQHKLHMPKITHYGMSQNPGRTFVVGFAPGSKGGPSFSKLFQFPNFGDNQVLANKSFFQADSVDVKWNSPGTAVLLLVQADVDKTGSSYYGKQQLHFMNIKGDTAMISLSKEGPIYSVSWSPKGDVFAVVHGFMPAKTALFNDKGNPVFDFGSGPKNLALFNLQSNILMIGGFGNLRGKIDMWDVTTPAKAVLISSFEAPDTTDVKWSPDGQHIVTTTCAPRLRQGNGFKVWHYSGSLIHELALAPPDELWEGDWQTGASPPFKISKQQVQGIQPSQPQVSKQVYRPPGARGTLSTFKLHDDDDSAVQSVVDAQNNKKNGIQAEPLSKTAQKNKKRREAARKKKDEEEAAGSVSSSSAGAAPQRAAAAAPQQDNVYKGAAGLLFDPEKEKKLKKLRDKLNSIQALKDQQAAGKTLEKNQLEKLSREQELLDELAKLTV